MRRQDAAALATRGEDGRATRIHPAEAKSLRLELVRPPRESFGLESLDTSLTQEQLEIMK